MKNVVDQIKDSASPKHYARRPWDPANTIGLAIGEKSMLSENSPKQLDKFQPSEIKRGFKSSVMQDKDSSSASIREKKDQKKYKKTFDAEQAAYKSGGLS